MAKTYVRRWLHKSKPFSNLFRIFLLERFDIRLCDVQITCLEIFAVEKFGVGSLAQVTIKSYNTFSRTIFHSNHEGAGNIECGTASQDYAVMRTYIL